VTTRISEGVLPRQFLHKKEARKPCQAGGLTVFGSTKPTFFRLKIQVSKPIIMKPKTMPIKIENQAIGLKGLVIFSRRVIASKKGNPKPILLAVNKPIPITKPNSRPLVRSCIAMICPTVTGTSRCFMSSDWVVKVYGKTNTMLTVTMNQRRKNNFQLKFFIFKDMLSSP